jgi:Mg2+ and Co2+ transporter CorA
MDKIRLVFVARQENVLKLREIEIQIDLHKAQIEELEKIKIDIQSEFDQSGHMVEELGGIASEILQLINSEQNEGSDDEVCFLFG